MQRIGIVGIGNISKIYLDNLAGMFAKRVTLTCAADADFSRAEKAARDYKIKAHKTADELINSANADIVLNLTPPKTHFEVALAAINAGKHVYNEKPLCIEQKEAEKLLNAAAKKGARIGCAPDTFLGAGLQTCKKAIEDGKIGAPVAAAAFVMSHGPEHWHPSPRFFYQYGGGPMFDMGPYYITALASLLGPVARVCGSARISIPARIITNQIENGAIMNVEVPTHIAATLDFKQGAVGTLITSFDVYSHSLPRIEIYGTEGTLQAPDPNTFGGPVKIKRFREEEWTELPLVNEYSENSRGLGVAEMAEAIERNLPHSASGALASHVLDIMHGIHKASETGKYVNLNCRALSF